jgi:hypothetical protein
LGSSICELRCDPFEALREPTKSLVRDAPSALMLRSASAVTQCLKTVAVQLAVGVLVFGSPAIAQPGSASPPDTGGRVVAGRVLRPVQRDLVPVRGVWVTLHRVGPDRAGPLDSVRTNARGGYEFRYRQSGDERALYFAAASFGGVAYFTPPLVAPTVRGETAEIVVYDTSSLNVPISVRGRHLVISAAGVDATRSVMEVYELANDSTVTRVSPATSSSATWVGLLPEGARDARAGEADVPHEAISFDSGRVKVVSPMPPGVKQLVYSYTLAATDFPLAIPLRAATDVYEVLIEEPSGSARGAKLAEVEPVNVDGRRFRRFLAHDVQPNAVAVIDIPRVAAGLDKRYVIALTVLLGGAMLVALARAFRRTY